MMWRIQQAMKDDAIQNARIHPAIHPGNRDEVFIWQNFHPAYRDIGWKNRALRNQTSPPSHMSYELHRLSAIYKSCSKKWRGDDCCPIAISHHNTASRSLNLMILLNSTNGLFYFSMSRMSGCSGHGKRCHLKWPSSCFYGVGCQSCCHPGKTPL